MRVAVIGAGFGGLTVAYRLAKEGINVTLFEADDKPGGLAVGFREPRWRWSLEKHYHHWFTNDYSVLNLAKEIRHKVITLRPRTSTYFDEKVYQLDSPMSLLKFDKLSVFDRFRVGLILAYLKFTPDWRRLERVTSQRFLKLSMGERAWEVLWEPLFEKKFAYYSSQIPAAWFWARIKKRTPSLAYPEGGFLAFARHISDIVHENNGNLLFDTSVENIVRKKNELEVVAKKKSYKFDKVICTLPSTLFVKMTKNLPQRYIDNLLNLKGIGAVNLVLSLSKQFLSDGTYWLNINEEDYPFLAVVEHTNFMDKKYYNNEHIVYVGNYLPHEHNYFQKDAKSLLKEFLPYLKKINPQFNESQIIRSYIFKSPFAQPIIPLNYSKLVPKFETPIKGLYLCNIQQVYPWDRGTNYAVENGEKVAVMVLKSR